MTFLLLVAQLTFATWQPATFPMLHLGYWRSCNGEERVLEHAVNGKLQWEMHLGSGEFALFEKRHDDLGSDHIGNLLVSPRVDALSTYRSARQWAVPMLHLWISVVRAGDAPEGCVAFFVKIEHQGRE